MANLTDDIERLQRLGGIPVEYSALREIYSGYASPASKVIQLCNQGLLIRIQRGLYQVAEIISGVRPDAFLVANNLYGPSYISLESALQEYGLIPEAVYTIESITMRRSKHFNTGLGHYNYYHVPSAYYSIGVQAKRTKPGYSYLIASPEKALCDHFVNTDRLQVRSRKAMVEYLTEFMRIDVEQLTNLDCGIIDAAASVGPKRQTLSYLKEAIKCLN